MALLKLLKDAVSPFWEQGTESVCVTVHCGRLYVGAVPPKICRVCGQAPKFVAMHREADPESILKSLGVTT